MDKQTKTLLGLGAIAVALYFILRPKGPNTQTPSTQTPSTPQTLKPQELVDEYNKMAKKQVSEGRSQFNKSEQLRAIEINKQLNSLGYAISSQGTLITLDEYNKMHESQITTGQGIDESGPYGYSSDNRQLGEPCVYAYEPAYILGVIGMQNGIKTCIWKTNMEAID